MATGSYMSRITKDIAHIRNGSDLSLAVGYRDSDVRHCRALIVGPPDTPYEFGFFEFDITFPKTYPIHAPLVRSVTTNGGRCRFNPNIYANGKVCLSILGTWEGEPGEQWSGAQGLESVLLSVQSLMGENPYENEPGFEDYKIENRDAKAYTQKIRHETLRIAVVQRLEEVLKIGNENRLENGSPDGNGECNGNGWINNGHDQHGGLDQHDVHEYDAEATYNSLNPSPWDPFADLLKRRFLWYYDSYVNTIIQASKEQKDGTSFRPAAFEGHMNAMEGTFQYEQLRKRLENIRDALKDEVKAWEAEGLRQMKNAAGLATQLAFQFKQLQWKWNEGSYDSSRMEIRLADPCNPFSWSLTVFGKPMTNLDGGIFNLSLSIPPDFPETWPRVCVETPIFHHRVSSSTGALCYFPAKPDEIGSHLEAIVHAIEDEQPRYDPRACINPEASKLFWDNDKEKRKLYNRKLRRSAQESSEY